MAEKKNYELFISYAEADKAWVEGYLLDALQEAEINFTCQSAFALGVPRISEFERAIRQSQATLLVISEAYLADGLRGFTDILAQSYGEQVGTWPVIPLTLQTGLQLSPRLKMLTGLEADNSEKQQDAIKRLYDRFKRSLPTAMAKPACPYLGMIPFSENDEELFFGRDEEIKELLGKLRLNSFLTIIGASGSGKSSLVFAGLIPQLKQSGLFGAGQWCIRSLRPGTSPLANLEKVLKGDITTLEITIEQLLSTQPDARRLLLVVDQFEELFTQAETEAITFQQTLLRLSEIDNVYLILTVRADFYPDLMGSLLWEKIRSRRFEVLSLVAKGLREAIVKPAEAVEVYIESALVERLIVDAQGEPGVLPLIQETLVLLWEKLERRFLALSAYELLVLPRPAYGATETQPRTGLEVAIARRADAAYADLEVEVKQAIARRIFLRLIQFGEGRPDTRRQQLEADLRSFEEDTQLFNETLQHLASRSRRLLTFSGEESDLQRKVDIAHEALISGWGKLHQWINQLREAEKTRRRLQEKAREWTRLDRKGGLLDEAELPEAESWLVSNEAKILGYDESLYNLITVSREKIEAVKRLKQEQQERELKLVEDNLQAEKLAKQKAQTLNWVAGIFSVLLTGATIFAFYQTRQSILSNIDALITSAESLQDSGSGLEAIEKNIEAGEHFFKKPLSRLLLSGDDRIAAKKMQVLTNLNALIYGFRERQSLTEHTDAVLGLNFSTDDDKLVSTSADGSMIIWDLNNNQRKTIIKKSEQQVNDAIFNKKGDSLISLHNKEIIRLWNLDPDTCFKESDETLVKGKENTIFNIAFSPNNETIASDEVNKINLWDSNNNSKAPLPDEHDDRINELDFSPDSKLIASAGGDKFIKVWDVKEKRLFEFFPSQVLDEDNYFSSVKFINNKTVVFSDIQAKMTIWNFHSNNKSDLSDPENNNKQAVHTLAVNADSKFIASGSEDGFIKIWDIENREHLNTYKGHAGVINKVAFSNKSNENSQKLASGGEDGIIKIWSIISPQIINGGKFSFNPDNDKIVTGDRDNGSIKIWSKESEKFNRHQTLGNSKNREKVFDVKFSFDGKTIVSTSSYEDKEKQEKFLIEIWNSEGKQKKAITNKDKITSINFSHDHKAFVTVHQKEDNKNKLENKVKIWQLESLENEELSPIDGLVQSVNYNPDGKSIAVLTRKEILLLSLAHQKESNLIKLETPDQNSLGVMSFSPDGKIIAAADISGKIYFWNLHQMRDLSEPDQTFEKINTGDKHVQDIVFSPGGEAVALAYDDKTAVIFLDLENVERSDFRILERPHESIAIYNKFTQQENSERLQQISFSPDGKILATSDSKNVVLWNFDFDKLLEIIPKNEKITEMCQ